MGVERGVLKCVLKLRLHASKMFSVAKLYSVNLIHDTIGVAKISAVKTVPEFPSVGLSQISSRIRGTALVGSGGIL